MKKFLNGRSLMLLAILLFPSLLYVVLSTGSHNFIKRPYYGPKTVSASGDTVYFKLENLDFLSCSNEPIEIERFKGNIVLYHFVNEDDPILEKRKASQLIALHDRFKEKSDIKIVSIVMSDASAACLFKEEYELNTSQWQVMSIKSSLEDVYAQFIHDIPNELVEKKWTDLFVLVDKKGRVRAYRDGVQYVEERALIDDIKILKAEEFIPKKKKKNEA